MKDELQERMDRHTKQFIDGLRRGSTVRALISDIVMSSARWGFDNAQNKEKKDDTDE